MRIDRFQIWCDVVTFEELLDADRSEEALSLCRGDFLEGFHLDGHREFDEGVEAQRRHYRELAVEAACLRVEIRPSSRV